VEENRKPKVCYLRGSYLNPFEAQYLEPLQDEFDLTAAYSRSHRFNIDSLKIPVVEMRGVDYFNGMLPRSIRHIPVPNVFKTLGYEEILLGLDTLLPEFDLIHSQEQSFYFSWQVAEKKAKYGYKMLSVQCMIDPYWYMDTQVVERARLVRQETDLFIARSQRARIALMGEGVALERIRVIGHGVDQERFHPGPKPAALAAELGVDPGRFIFLFVGRLVWAKGVYPLVDAFNLLLQDPQVKALDPLLLIVGKGKEELKLKRRVELLGIENNVHFAGKQAYDTIPDVHRLADIFVLPSISERYVVEQFGIVLIEAMASGKPVIAASSGAIDEVVGDAGLLVPANDSWSLYRAFQNVVTDPGLREDMAEQGLRRVEENFTHEIMSNKLREAYWDALLDRYGVQQPGIDGSRLVRQRVEVEQPG
jgi:alpha-maltose-1-phosphate synthase